MSDWHVLAFCFFTANHVLGRSKQFQVWFCTKLFCLTSWIINCSFKEKMLQDIQYMMWCVSSHQQGGPCNHHCLSHTSMDTVTTGSSVTKDSQLSSQCPRIGSLWSHKRFFDSCQQLWTPACDFQDVITGLGWCNRPADGDRWPSVFDLVVQVWYSSSKVNISPWPKVTMTPQTSVHPLVFQIDV